MDGVYIVIIIVLICLFLCVSCCLPIFFCRACSLATASNSCSFSKEFVLPTSSAIITIEEERPEFYNNCRMNENNIGRKVSGTRWPGKVHLKSQNRTSDRVRIISRSSPISTIFEEDSTAGDA